MTRVGSKPRSVGGPGREDGAGTLASFFVGSAADSVDMNDRIGWPSRMMPF